MQGSLVAPLRPGSGAAPGLALPSLAGASGEAPDASSLAVLLQFSFAAQKDEEEVALTKAKEAEEAKEKEERKAKLEERMLAINRCVRDGTSTPAEEAAWRRWMVELLC